jgi:hypothetical protein
MPPYKLNPIADQNVFSYVKVNLIKLTFKSNKKLDF